ncbi:stimulated by retinoic acid gene 6 protein-like [Rana temporaria]|uniref:stimulated by retinoic acid gene 6 protein-like n=1 Tax=Rana temporaria TaxID=8407 RepID=UPI001AAC9D1A|nr:stimulated by retinoic acid gene 6 protein-like [Rana temporaria]
MDSLPTYSSFTTANHTDGETPGTCQKSIHMELFVHYSLIPAVLITVSLSYLQRRATHQKTTDKIPLGRRFGIVVPVNFISSYSNRWSYGAACGATATTVFLLFHNEYSNYFNFTAPIWAKALVYLLCALEVGLDYYPFFACLSTNNRVIGSTLGFCYSLCWFCVQLADVFECPTINYESIILILTPIPSLVCCVFLMGRFLQILVTSVLSIYRQVGSKEEEEPLLPEHLKNYLRHLLKPTPEKNVQTSSIKEKIYKWDYHFKFPTRMIVTAVLCLTCLYNFVLVDLLVSPKAVKGLDSLILRTVNFSFSGQTKLILYLLKECWFYATFPAALTSVIYMIHVLSCYRKDMKKLYGGTSEIDCTGSPPVVLAASIRYTGNQVAYLLWGYFLLHIMFFLISLIITFWFVIPIQEGRGLVVLQGFGYTVLGIVLMIAVMLAQVVAAQFLFLQDKILPTDKGKPLAINNRRGFQNFSYFFMFYSAILGLGSCLLRVIFNVFLGSWLLARIDRPLFPRGFEGADMGYNTWTGMLQVDLYHTHPVILSFCHLLTQEVSRRSHASPDVLMDYKNRHTRTKWHLAYTLINNPALVLNRKQSCCRAIAGSQSPEVLQRLLVSALQCTGRKWMLPEKDMENSASTDLTVQIETVPE